MHTHTVEENKHPVEVFFVILSILIYRFQKIILFSDMDFILSIFIFVPPNAPEFKKFQENKVKISYNMNVLFHFCSLVLSQ